MLEVIIPNKTFSSTTAVAETSFAISLENFDTALKLAGKKESIKLTLTDSDTYLKIDIGDITKSVRLLDNSLVKNPPAPVLAFDLSYTLNAESLKRAITATKSVGDVLTLHFDGSSTKITVDSKMERVEAPLETSNTTIVSTVAVSSLYSVRYLTNIVKHIGSKVIISWGANKPLKLFSDDGSITLNWLLAPRNTN